MASDPKLRVLVLGAYGFLGSAACARLAASGHDVIAAGRNLKLGRKQYPQYKWRKADFDELLQPESWTEILSGVDAVVNCVGVLQDSIRDNTQNAHVTAVGALVKACEAAGIKRLVHISAVGAEEGAKTAYAHTKLEGARLIEDSNLDWIILEPSLVVGRNAYGGTRLIRMLAGMPGLIPMALADTKFQPVHVSDFARAVELALAPEAKTRGHVEVAGPESITLAGIVLLVRQWLGFGKARILRLPEWMMWPALWLGDLFGMLGARTSFRSTSIKQMKFNVGGDPKQAEDALGLTTRPIAQAMADEPANISDRVYARGLFASLLARWMLGLYLLVPALIGFLQAIMVKMDQSLQDTYLASTYAVLYVWMPLKALLGFWFLSGAALRRACLVFVAFVLAYLAYNTATFWMQASHFSEMANVRLFTVKITLGWLQTLVHLFPQFALAILIAAFAEER